MPIDPAMLAKSIGTLTDLQPSRTWSQLFDADAAGVMHDATLERRWGEIALTFVEVQIRSG
jgi:hypothetical protein